jgi:uncharacterized protein
MNLSLPTLLLVLAALLAPAVPALADTPETDAVQVVYHLDDAQRFIAAYRNIQNHLAAAPDTRIVVVALSHGVDFLIDGAKDDRGNPYEPMIDDLSFAGVAFRVCNNTLQARQIDPDTLHPEIKLVPSGVAEIARLQAREGFAYIKP